VTSLRKGLLKCVHLGVCYKSPTEITRSGGVWNSCGAERVEIGFVTAFEFEVFQALSIRQGVVRDVEYMIRFVIRKVKLQQLDVAINRVNEPALSSERMFQPEASITDRFVSISDLVLNIACLKHRGIAGFRFMFDAIDN